MAEANRSSGTIPRGIPSERTRWVRYAPVEGSRNPTLIETLPLVGDDRLQIRIVHGDSQPRRREHDHVEKVAAHPLRRRIPGVEIEAGEHHGAGRKQHLLDPARDREVQVELLALDLDAQRLGVVERERGLLRDREDLPPGVQRRAVVGGRMWRLTCDDLFVVVMCLKAVAC